MNKKLGIALRRQGQYKILLLTKDKKTYRTKSTFGFAYLQPKAEKPKEPFFANAPTEKN